MFGQDPQRVGNFRFFLDGQRWEWSDAVARMHGYQPGEIVPTTELLLSHKHPEDHPHVARVLDRMISAAEPFSSTHRILDTTGNVHQVVVGGDRLRDDTGAVVGTTGFYIDLTDTYRDEVKESVDEAVAELEQSRAVIEQAKGALMLVYGISADRAFDVLVWRSQQTNTPRGTDRRRIRSVRIWRGSAYPVRSPIAHRPRGSPAPGVSDGPGAGSSTTEPE